jgi:hypothetical protein
MKYIDKHKLFTYLKLKKEMALFLGVGEYFESKTFDWIKIEYHPDRIKCTKIRTFDEGDAISNDIRSFSTLNDMEGEDEEEHVEGTLEYCLDWINKIENADTGKFIVTEDLNEIYLILVENGALGN